MCEVGGYVMGERVKDVYVTWEICEKEVYVMRDMKDVYVMGEGVKDVYVTWVGGKRCLCNVGEGVKDVYVMREGVKDVYVMGERG